MIEILKLAGGLGMGFAAILFLAGLLAGAASLSEGSQGLKTFEEGMSSLLRLCGSLMIASAAVWALSTYLS